MAKISAEPWIRQQAIETRDGFLVGIIMQHTQHRQNKARRMEDIPNELTVHENNIKRRKRKRGRWCRRVTSRLCMMDKPCREPPYLPGGDKSINKGLRCCLEHTCIRTNAAPTARAE